VRRCRNRRTFSIPGVVLPSPPGSSGSSDAMIVPISSSSDLDSHRTLFFDPPSSSDSLALADAVDKGRFGAPFLIA